MRQLVNPNLKQTSDVAMCAYFVFHAFGGKNGFGFQWARQAWEGQHNRHHGHPPLGIAVPIWHDYWATLGGIYRNWGHVSVRLPDGRVLSSPYPTYGSGQRVYANIAAMEADMRLGAYLGWSESMDGTRIVEPKPAPNPVSNNTHPLIAEKEEDEMKLWIADVSGAWYLVVPTGAGKPNAVALPGDSGMGGKGAANAGIPVIGLKTVAALRKVANV